MRNKLLWVPLLVGMHVGVLVGTIHAQGPFAARATGTQNLTHRIDLPNDAPVALVSDEWAGTAATVRGGLFSIDVKLAVSLRNASAKRIRSVTLSVIAMDAAPGGKGSISVPSLDAAPGETFSVRGDLHLVRPVSEGANPLVEVSLDGILFDDLTFYGADRLQSRRSMMVWELEARRDRQYFKSVLAQNGKDGLEREFRESMVRESERPQFNVKVLRGRSTNTESARDVQFAFLHTVGSPLELMDGVARVAGNEAEAPKLIIHNRSGRPVNFFEVGWVVRDRQGREFLAASLPIERRLPPRSSSQILESASLRFEGTSVDSMTGFLSSVEYTDGTFWIPSRADLASPPLRGTVTPSPEEQRLLQIYRKRGAVAVMEELKRF